MPYKGGVGKRKMIRIFLIGTLCGVIITAAAAYLFAIPANDCYWRMEIWKRGGAAWTTDKNGHFGWKWLVEPIPDAPPVKPVTVPLSATKVRTEKL
jgi:hypothetical protein